MSAASIRAGNAYIELVLRRSKFFSALRGTERQFAGSMQRMGRSVALLGAKMTGLGVAGAAAFSPAVREFAKFERAMDEVRSITGAGSQAFDSLIAKAKELGATTVFSSTNAANAMTVFARAGLSVEEIISSIGPTLDAAAVGHLDMAEAARIVTGVMKGMKIPFDQTEHAIDVLTQATISANTDIQQMGDAFRYVGPLGQLAGESIQMVAAAVSSLADANITGEMAGTTLRGALLALQDPSKEAITALQGMGLQIEDTQGNFVGLVNVIGQMERAFDGLGSRQIIGKLGKVFQQRQAAGIAQLVSTGAADLQARATNFGSARGITKELANLQLDNLSGDFTRFISVLTNVGIAIGSALGDPLRTFLQSINEGLRWIEAFANENKEMVALVAGGFAALAVLGTSLVGLGLTFGVIGFAIGGLISAIGLMVLPIVTLIGSITALGSAIVSVATGAVGLLVSGLSALTGAAGFVIGAFASVSGAAAGTFGPMIVWVTRVGMLLGRLPAMFVRAFSVARTVVASVTGSFYGMVTVINLAYTAWLALLGEFLGLGTASKAIDSFGNAIKRVLAIVSSVFSRIASMIIAPFRWVGKQISLAAGFIGDVFAQVGKNIASVFQSAFTFAAGVLNTFVEYSMGIGSAIGSVFGNAGKAINAHWDDIWSTFKTTFQGIYDALAGGDLGQAGRIAMLGLKSVVIQVMDTVAETFGTTLDGMVGGFIDAISEIQFAWMRLQRLIKEGQNFIADRLAETGEYVGILPEGTSDALNEDQARADQVFKANQAARKQAILDKAEKRKAGLKEFFANMRKADAQLRTEAFDASIKRKQRELNKPIDRDNIKAGKFSLEGLGGLGDRLGGLDDSKNAIRNNAAQGTFVGAAAAGLGGAGGMIGAIEKTTQSVDRAAAVADFNAKKEREKMEKLLRQAERIKVPMLDISRTISTAGQA